MRPLWLQYQARCKGGGLPPHLPGPGTPTEQVASARGVSGGGDTPAAPGRSAQAISAWVMWPATRTWRWGSGCLRPISPWLTQPRQSSGCRWRRPNSCPWAFLSPGTLLGSGSGLCLGRPSLPLARLQRAPVLPEAAPPLFLLHILLNLNSSTHCPPRKLSAG